MIKEDKYLTRRHLEAYSEIKLARLLEKKNYTTFFPFKDRIAVDMVVIKDGEKEIELYQLKARNQSMEMGKGIYWFNLKKDIKKLSKLKSKNIFFILCALQENQKDFHFFKIPLKVVLEYFKQKEESNKNCTFFDMKRGKDMNYKIMPYRIKNIDLDKFRLK